MPGSRHRCGHREHGSAAILVVGILVGAMFLIALLGAVGGAYVAHAELQQAADIVAASAERGGDGPGGRARRLARANGARRVQLTSAADGRIHVVVQRAAPKLFGVPAGMMLEAEAWAAPSIAGDGDGGPNPPGAYAGPLETVPGGARACPRAAAAFNAMAGDASRDGVALVATSGFRSYAEQAVLYARLGPRLAAPPGTSRHHDATEFDIAVGPAGSPTHRWLTAHGPTHGFIQRYSWEPWHWGFVAGC
ncbi:MAG: D-alanyl-D-alanine carboxypeptidase family protein [Thermoleophilia bacterium]|nr:D-alanyl-D-alanine carboxypeptidase family protein [Thermoleophilia bacterium]